MSLKAQIALLVSAFAALSCGKVIKNNCMGEVVTSDFAKLEFKSEEVIGKSLAFCKGGRSPKTVIAEVPSRKITSLSVGGETEYNSDGPTHLDGACNDNGRKTYQSSTVPVALRSESFNDAKLCYYNSEMTKVAIVQVNENCPEGTQQQLHPVDDCAELNKQ